MVRAWLVAVSAMAVFGCSRVPAPAPVVPAVVEAAPTTAPALPEPKPLLSPEPPSGVKPLGRDASDPGEVYPRPGFQPPQDGTSPAPELIPVLPVRKPAQVLGDLRFLSRDQPGAVAVSPDGKWLATGSVRLFNLATGNEEITLHGRPGRASKMVFSPDSRRLYSCGEHTNAALVVWDFAARREVIALPVTDWSLSADGKTLATLEAVQVEAEGNDDGWKGMVLQTRPVVRLRDTSTWEEVAGYAVNDFRPVCLALSPDGDTLALGGSDGTVRTWGRRAGKELARLAALADRPDGVPPERYSPAVTRLTFNAAGTQLAASSGGLYLASHPRRVAVWDWPAGELAHRWDHGVYDLLTLLFAPDGKSLVAADGNRATAWDLATGAARATLDVHANNRWFGSAAFAPAGDGLYVSGEGSRVQLVAVPSCERLPIAAPPPRDGPVEVPFDLDGPVAPGDARLGRNAEIRLPDGSTLERYDFKRRDVFGVLHVGPDGKPIRGFEKDRIVVFDATADGKLLASHGHNSDGQGYDHPVRFWDIATGREVAAIRAYPRPDYVLRFSPDGRRLAVLHSDGLVRLWDVATRKPLLALDPDGYRPTRLTFSKDGTRFVGGDDKSPALVVWDVTDPKE